VSCVRCGSQHPLGLSVLPWVPLRALGVRSQVSRVSSRRWPARLFSRPLGPLPRGSTFQAAMDHVSEVKRASYEWLPNRDQILPIGPSVSYWFQLCVLHCTLWAALSSWAEHERVAIDLVSLFLLVHY
jgi:hypothetical protein